MRNTGTKGDRVFNGVRFELYEEFVSSAKAARNKAELKKEYGAVRIVKAYGGGEWVDVYVKKV